MGDVVAAAAAIILPAFSMEDASKLLLAVAKTKCGATGKGVANLYARTADVVAPKLKDLSAVQLIKVVLAIGKLPACRPLLEAAATEAVNRVSDIPSAQMILLVQGLLPLGGHPALSRILDLWAVSFGEASRLENLLGPDQIAARRSELEAKGQLTADQLAKLAQMLGLAMPTHNTFWAALGRRIRDSVDDLTDVGQASLEAAFPNGAGPEFDGKSKLLKAVVEAGKERDREREQERDRSGDKEWEKERDRKKDRSKERERNVEKDRDKKKERERSRSRDKDKDKDREKSRDREREKEKDREKSRDREREK